MNIPKKPIKYIFILFFVIIVSIFFIPDLISLFKTYQKINQLTIKANEYKIKKVEYQKKLENINNNSEILLISQEEIISKLKEQIKINSYYFSQIEERKREINMISIKNNIMEVYIKLYENYNIFSSNIINNLQIFFKNHTLEDYYNDISNILLTSSIINNESDIDFIYNKIIPEFYFDFKNNDNDKKYILGIPCFKATIDTNEPYIFHKKCNKYRDTIMFIKTNKTRFGGITDLSWGKYYYEKNEYINTKTKLFNLDNQKIFRYDKNNKINFIPPIRGDKINFAIFGYNDIYLGYLPWESSSSFPQQFLNDNNTNKKFNDLLNEYNDPFLNGIKFEYLDVEVYPIILINMNHKQ